MAEDTKPKAARKAASPKGQRKGTFEKGIAALKSARASFGRITIDDAEHDLMFPVVRKLDQFIVAIEKKDPGLIDAVNGDNGGTTAPAESTMYTESTVIDDPGFEEMPPQPSE